MKSGGTPPPPQHPSFTSYLFYLGKKEKIRKIKAKYEIDADGWYLGIKEVVIENAPAWQCWFCGGDLQSGSSHCTNKSCENHSKDNDEKGNCQQCNKNDYLVDGKICFNCALTNFRLVIQQLVKEESLKAVQIIWEQKKAEIEGQFRQSLSNLERTDPTMARTVRENMNRMIETIEGDLYPERKKQEDKKGEIIKWVVIGGVAFVVISLIIYFLCRKKEK